MGTPDPGLSCLSSRFPPLRARWPLVDPGLYLTLCVYIMRGGKSLLKNDSYRNPGPGSPWPRLDPLQPSNHQAPQAHRLGMGVRPGQTAFPRCPQGSAVSKWQSLDLRQCDFNQQARSALPPLSLCLLLLFRPDTVRTRWVHTEQNPEDTELNSGSLPSDLVLLSPNFLPDWTRLYTSAAQSPHPQAFIYTDRFYIRDVLLSLPGHWALLVLWL